MRNLLLSLALLFTVSCGSILSNQDACKANWSGYIGTEFLEKAKKDLKDMRSCSRVDITLYSPGGSVFDTLEVVREMEEAKKYQIVAVHGRTMVASGATVILGSGTKGYRFVHTRTIGLIHGMQISNGFSRQCVEYNSEAVSEDDRFLNAILIALMMEYADAAGKSYEEVFGWLECDNTQIGPGIMFVKLGLADHVEE